MKINPLVSKVRAIVNETINKSFRFHHRDVHTRIDEMEKLIESSYGKLTMIEKILINHYKDDML